MIFLYQARTTNGEIKTGTIEAPSREAAAELLRRQGLFVTQLKQPREKLTKKSIYLKVYQQWIWHYLRASFR